MKRYVVVALMVASTAGFLLFADGCALDPFNLPDIQYGAGGTVTGSSSSSGAGGMTGTGGMAGGGGMMMVCTCPDDGNECTDDLVGECPDGDVTKCHTVVVSRGCTQASGGAGACTDEGICAAVACTTNSDCTGGKPCVDGYCCNEICSGQCNACNRVSGLCQRLPTSMPGECPTGQLCGNAGACVAATKLPIGSLCTFGTDCEAGVCYSEICLSPFGQPCAEDIECASNLCDPVKHQCVSCETAGPCPNGAICLPGGRCQVPAGKPGENKADCVPPAEVFDGLTCTLPIGAACTAHEECIYRRCEGAPNGTCGNLCAAPADCPLGTTCVSGSCTLPTGAYCVTGAQCDSGKCGGFPRRCQ